MRVGVVGIGVGVAALGASLLLVAASRQSPDAESDPVADGRKLFVQYCAPCHGLEAKGDGPVAASLKRRPPDLTQIQKAGERFPAGLVMDLVAGDKVVRAHGSRIMPVWGTVLRDEKGYTQSQEDLSLLVKYLQSIQVAK